MKQPVTHDKAHPCWPHKWNPYAKRDYNGHLLDKTTFHKIIDGEGREALGSIKPELFSGGCLDAPEEIPLGATACVGTVGGYFREEYLTLGREWESYAAHERASYEVAQMLKQILEEQE